MEFPPMPGLLADTLAAMAMVMPVPPGSILLHRIEGALQNVFYVTRARWVGDP